MANEIRHASATKPRVYPWNNDTQPIDIDRVQSISGGVNQPQELVYEAGRLDKVCTDLKILEESCSLTQLEYGEIDFYLALANKAAMPSGGLQLSDFDDSLVDIISVGKDKFGGTMEQTMWLPKLSLNSLAFNIPDADSRIERTFDLGGDFFKILKNANKIFMQKIYTVPSGYSTSAWTQVISDPAPVLDPNVASKYIQRVLRVRSGVTTELELTTDYTWTNGTTTLTILSATTGDIIKVAYTTGSFGSGGDYTTLNDVDLCYINADLVKVTLESAAQGVELELDRLTSLNLTATLNRISEGVIGLREKLLKNVESYAVTVALNGRIKDTPIEDVLMGQAGTSFGIIDPDLFKTDLVLRVYVYEDSTKATFKLGYKITGLAFADTTDNADANNFWQSAVNLASDNMLISDQEADIDV
jgi:hypothetical protein